METLYRKVAVSERLPDNEGNYHCIFSDGHIFTILYLKEYSFLDEFTDCSGITHWLEEIAETIKSDNTQTFANALHQIEKLEADKAELLEVLEKVLHGGYLDNLAMMDEIESLIQKLKQ